MRRIRRQHTFIKEPATLNNFFDEFADFEPDPIKVGLYRIIPEGRRQFLANLAWYERSLADIKARFGGGVYQIVGRYRGRVKITPVFEIEGAPIYDHT
jgi:hypothetical protein